MNQNNLFTFKVFFPFWVNLNIITFFLIVEIVLSVDQQFEACKPWNCGNNVNISYPFWVQGKQDPSCGMQGFELTCKNDKPILNMSGDDYVVRDIFYKNQSIWVTNAKILANTCPSSIQNLSLPQTLFSFGPSHAKLFLFFNCTTPFPNKEYQFNPTGCSTYNLTRRSLALFSHDHNFNYLMNHSGNCENNVVAAVDKDDDKLQYRDDINILLGNGFHLVWKAINCSVCQGSGGRCGFDYSKNNFMCFCTDRPHRVRCNGHKKPNVGKKLGIGFGAGASGILLSCFLFFFIYRFHSKYCSSRSISFSSNSKTDLEYGSTYFGVHIFTYTELKEATNNFDISRELGDGGFGTVYHGKLRDGRVVAVKRLYENNYKRVEQFMNEVEILTRLRHQNLVTLYGCTSRNSRELLLVYEFIPNGTVGDHLHGDRSTSGMLTWPIRMNIAIETASALAYLHACDIIHRDVKTNNILLDNNFGVKVADFGLSRPFPTNVTHVSTAPQGTPGYVDPKYYQCYQLTDKSDVYSFGVVLFELISSKTAVDISRSHNEINLSNMAVNMIQNGALHELVDPGLGFESDWKVRRIITLVADLAYRCLQQEKEIRPSMEEVLESLRRIERGEWKEGMAEEVDIPSDEIGLLPVSLDSPMTDKSINVSTTPNTSG